MGRLHGKPVSRESATAGLPLARNGLTPSLLIRAAERAGFAAKLVRRPFRKIPAGVLPAVLVLHGSHAGVLVSVDGGHAEMIFPEVAEGSARFTLREIEEQYSGYAIFLKPKFSFEERADLRSAPRPSSWFWGTLWHFRRFYLRLIPASLLINLFAVATPLFIMTVYDRVVPHQAIETLWVLAIGVGIVFGFEFVIRMLRGYFVDRAGKRADAVMASALFEQILGIQVSAKPASSGAFANQARAYESLREFFTSATLVALVDLPFVFIFIWLIGIFGGAAMAAIPFAAVVLALGAGILLQIPLRRSVRQAYQTGLQRHAILVETINGLESVKAAGAESTLQRRMEECVRQSADLEVKSRWYSALATNVTTILTRLVTIAIVIVSVYQIQAGNMTMGAMIACVILGGRGLAPLAQVAGLLTKLQQSMAALRGLNQIMEMPQERSAGASSPILSRPDWRPDIEFKNVNFSYPQQKSFALRDLSVKIGAGERVAILGRTGSGKSTLLRLIMKFYGPTGGVLKIGGIDAAQLDPAELRRHIGYLPQQVTLFYGSVADNILMGNPWAESAVMKTAARAAGVDKLVDPHPLGYDLPVGERGEMLSGGQRQAVAIARALVREPALLLFDEPSTGMDSNAEREFVEALTRYLEANPGRTLVLATHRTSLLKLVDRIVVLEEGRAVADGPKAEVLAKLRAA